MGRGGAADPVRLVYPLIAQLSRLKFEKDSSSLTFQPFDSRNLIISNVPKVGERRSQKKWLQVFSPFFFLFPASPTFCVPFSFAFPHYPRDWNRLGTFYSTICASFFWVTSSRHDQGLEINFMQLLLCPLLSILINLLDRRSVFSL